VLTILIFPERDVILKMLQAGYNDCEEVRLSKAIGEVLKPDASASVQEWLKTASESGSDTSNLINLICGLEYQIFFVYRKANCAASAREIGCNI
jgi:hypothetical protein